MTWSHLANQFCLELGFGVLLALAFVPRAPVGLFFYRLMGTTAAVPLLAAVLVSVSTGQASWTDPFVLATGASLLGYPIIAGPFRGRRWATALAWSLVWVAAALVFVVSEARYVEGATETLVASLSAVATGSVAGSVGLAMVLGHWYLTVPKLEVEHLTRLNRVTIVTMIASVALIAVSCLVFRTELGEAKTPLLSDWGLFYLSGRMLVGLAVPLVFAWMTASSLKFRNTRSATGILYASTILVLIGTAISISLQDTYGVPL